MHCNYNSKIVLKPGMVCQILLTLCFGCLHTPAYGQEPSLPLPPLHCPHFKTGQAGTILGAEEVLFHFQDPPHPGYFKDVWAAEEVGTY